MCVCMIYILIHMYMYVYVYVYSYTCTCMYMYMYLYDAVLEMMQVPLMEEERFTLSYIVTALLGSCVSVLLQCVAVCCVVFRCVAVCCSVMQCVYHTLSQPCWARV